MELKIQKLRNFSIKKKFFVNYICKLRIFFSISKHLFYYIYFSFIFENRYTFLEILHSCVKKSNVFLAKFLTGALFYFSYLIFYFHINTRCNFQLWYSTFQRHSITKFRSWKSKNSKIVKFSNWKKNSSPIHKSLVTVNIFFKIRILIWLHIFSIYFWNWVHVFRNFTLAGKKIDFFQ